MTLLAQHRYSYNTARATENKNVQKLYSSQNLNIYSLKKLFIGQCWKTRIKTIIVRTREIISLIEILMEKKTKVSKLNSNKTKTKLKEKRETKQLFNSICEKILDEKFEKLQNDLKEYCESLVTTQFNDIRREITITESNFTTKFNDLRSKLDKTTDTLNEMEKKIDNSKKESEEYFKSQLSTYVENDKSKFKAIYEKLKSKNEKEMAEVRSIITSINEENIKSFSALHEDLKAKSNEVIRIKENVDELLLKRYGFIPGNKNTSEGLSASFNQGLDAGYIIENLANRIKILESQLNDDLDNETTFDLDASAFRNKSFGSPSKLNSSIMVKKSSTKKIRKLEEYIFDIRSQLREHENDMTQIRSTLHNKFKMNEKYPTTALSNYEVDRDELKSIQKKLKKLTESTTRACRSLSTGLSDVQQATIQIYNWSDETHRAIGMISNKIGINNPCPRAKVYVPKNQHIQ